MVSDNKKFYNSKQWKNLRRIKLGVFPLCEQCQIEGRITVATQVDHIVAISNGGSLTDLKNLRSLCAGCHSRKTLHVERMGKKNVPIRGCDINGISLDPNHPWNLEEK